nr:MarR family winged helix-turn-helix transcriptional regulator [Neglectibacter sp. X4]
MAPGAGSARPETSAAPGPRSSSSWQRSTTPPSRWGSITHPILAVIVELSESDIEITQKKISDFSMIDPMTVSSTLRLLEKKGLTQRIQSKVDSRANTICNTDNGLSVLKEAIKAVESVDISFFFETENDTEVFQKLLFQLKNKNNKNL